MKTAHTTYASDFSAAVDQLRMFEELRHTEADYASRLSVLDAASRKLTVPQIEMCLAMARQFRDKSTGYAAFLRKEHGTAQHQGAADTVFENIMRLDARAEAHARAAALLEGLLLDLHTYTPAAA